MNELEKSKERMFNILYNTNKLCQAEDETDEEFKKRILENTKNS
jgi:hypothetical protein